MKNYCTLFDSFYLSRGLAMYESLKACSKDFHLFIFAFDDLSYGILSSMSLDSTTIISLSDFENSDLLRIKPSRSKAEYCWTCTPSSISYVLDNYDVPDCTYIDSDLLFFSDPSILIDELTENHKNTLITEHRFSPLPKLYEEKRSGRFCVQFITFSRESDSLAILEKWKLQCIDWCFAKHENGKFGDQKYLDEWPLNYPNVHILENPGGGIAPWNVLQYNFVINGNRIKGTEKKSGREFDVIFFHFQYVKFLENGTYDCGWYLIPPAIKKMFYLPYLTKMDELEKSLKDLNPEYCTGYTKFKINSLKSLLKVGIKSLFGYNIMKTK